MNQETSEQRAQRSAELQECFRTERHILFARVRATEIDKALASLLADMQTRIEQLRRELLGPHDCAILDSLDGEGEETLLQLAKRQRELLRLDA